MLRNKPTPPLNQAYLIDKFKKYHAIKVKRRAKLYPGMEGGDLLPDSLGGLCHGFAVCHSVMAAIGELDWWKALCNTITDWDENESSLTKSIRLPGSDIEYPLDFLFERAIHYVLLHQVDDSIFDKTKFNLNELSRQNFLLKKKDPFEVDTFHGMKKVQDRVSAVCLCSENKLGTLIDGNLLKNYICLISSETHTCSLRHENGTWYFYDPNYPGGEKEFNNKAALIQEMRERLIENPLDPYIHIEIASLDGMIDEDLKKNYRTITIPDKTTTITGYQLRAIAWLTPKSLPMLLESVKNNPILQESFAKALTMQIDSAWTTLHFIAFCTYKCIPTLLQLVQNNSILKKCFSVALSVPGNDGWTALHLLIYYSPDTLSDLLKIASNSPDIQKNLLKALSTKIIHSTDPKILNLNGLELLKLRAPLHKKKFDAFFIQEYQEGKIAMEQLNLYFAMDQTENPDRINIVNKTDLLLKEITNQPANLQKGKSIFSDYHSTDMKKTKNNKRQKTTHPLSDYENFEFPFLQRLLKNKSLTLENVNDIITAFCSKWDLELDTTMKILKQNFCTPPSLYGTKFINA